MIVEININDKLYDDISDYVNINSLGDINHFIVKMIVNGFNTERYGNNPFEIILKQNIQKNNKPIKKITKEEIKTKDIIEDKEVNNGLEEFKPKEEKKKKVRIIKKD